MHIYTNIILLQLTQAENIIINYSNCLAITFLKLIL
jgi:hypothetical protein